MTLASRVIYHFEINLWWLAWMFSSPYYLQHGYIYYIYIIYVCIFDYIYINTYLKIQMDILCIYVRMREYVILFRLRCGIAMQN